MFNPLYKTYTSRLESFKDVWPSTSSFVNIEDLAGSGLYYYGFEDTVLCFWGGCGLRNFNPGDCPYVEHLRLFDKCDYIQNKCKQMNISLRKSEGPKKWFWKSSSKQENEKEKEEELKYACNICFERPLNALFRPCLHVYTCMYCCRNIHDCPICRCPLDRVEKIYL